MLILSREHTLGGVTHPVRITTSTFHNSIGVEFYFLISVTPAVPMKRILHGSPCIVGIPCETGAPHLREHGDAFPRLSPQKNSASTENRFPISCAEPGIRWQPGMAPEPPQSHSPPQNRAPPPGFNPGSPKHQHGAFIQGVASGKVHANIPGLIINTHKRHVNMINPVTQILAG